MNNAEVSKLSYLYKFLTPEIQFAIKQATISRLKEKLHCGYERFNKGEFECLIASFIVMMCAPQPNMKSYFGSTEFFSYPFIQEMFSNYDIKTYLSCLSFYERTVKDDEDSEEESNSEQESEDEILSEPDENSQIEDTTINFLPVKGPKIVDETKPSSITAQLVNEFLLTVDKLFIRHMPDFTIISMDESLIPCKCKCCHKVYMPQKPHKYGTLVRCACCARTGYCVSLFLHQSNIKYTCEGIFQRLIENLPNKIYKMISDNYYSTTKSINFLVNARISYVGTIRSNRIVDQQKNMELNVGQCRQIPKNIHHPNFFITVYQATKSKKVYFAHTNNYMLPQKEQCWLDINCSKPQVVQYYNYYTRGVDHMDQMIEKVRWKHRTTRWPVKVFFHCLGIMLHNAFVLWTLETKSKITFVHFCLDSGKNNLIPGFFGQVLWGFAYLADTYLCDFQYFFNIL
ncbi:Transposase_IS4 [Hexamita inflata]|uniref:Transposase IS4 n=1 Tax=Hexamita inflata TaxID=28002 RepID=A0AA86NAR3_9EUKA|nr:Transposase IS4 [Hexamita inflata]